jgi:hypothetical protein
LYILIHENCTSNKYIVNHDLFYHINQSWLLNSKSFSKKKMKNEKKKSRNLATSKALEQGEQRDTTVHQQQMY